MERLRKECVRRKWDPKEARVVWGTTVDAFFSGEINAWRVEVTYQAESPRVFFHVNGEDGLRSAVEALEAERLL